MKDSETSALKNNRANNSDCSIHQLRMMAVAQNSPSAFSIKDIQGHFLIANQNFDKILGVSSEEMIGKTVYDFFPKKVSDQLARNDHLVKFFGLTDW